MMVTRAPARNSCSAASTADAFDRGVLPADQDDVETIGEVRFVEVLADVRQVFTRDAELVDVIEIASRQHELVP